MALLTGRGSGRSSWRRLAVVGTAILAAAGVVAVAGPGAQHAAHASANNKGGDFVALTPEVHVLDTRSAIGITTKTAIPAAKTIAVQVAGVGAIPAGVTGVMVDVTATQGTATTFLTLGPDDASFPNPSATTPANTSNLNVPASTTLSNSSVVPVAADGKIKVYNSAGSVHIVIDVQGYYTTATGSLSSGPGGLIPTDYTRVLDTRTGLGQASGKPVSIASGGSLTVNLSLVSAIPAGASSAYFDAIVLGADGGWLGSYPAGSTAGYTSVFDFLAGTTASGISVKIGTNNSVVFVNKAAAKIDLILTAEGYTTSDSSTGSAYRPARFRAGLVTVQPNATADFQVTGRNGLPTRGVTAVAANFGVAPGTAAGHILAYPTDANPIPTASLDNFTASVTRADFGIIKAGPDGKIRVQNVSGTAVRIYVDVQGWYTDGRTYPVDTVPNTPMSLVQSSLSGPIEGVYIRSTGTPFHTLISNTNLSSPSTAAVSNNQEAFTGQPSVVALGTNLLVSMLHANNGEVWQFTVPAAADNATVASDWSPTFVHTGGIMASAPATGAFTDGTTAETFAVDSNGQLWGLSSVAGSYWQALGADVNLVGTPTIALNRGQNALNIVARNTAGNVVVATYTAAGGLGPWTNTGGTAASRPAAIELTGPRLRIAALQSNGSVATVLQNLDGTFPAWKTVVAAVGQTFVGAPALTLDEDRGSSADPGTDEAVILARDSQDGHIYESSETTEASNAFGPWAPHTSPAASTDPTAIQTGGVTGLHWVGVYVDISAAPTAITQLPRQQ